LLKLHVLHSHLPHKFFKGRLRRSLNCLLFLGLLLLLDWWRNVWSAWVSNILEGRSRLLLLLLRARPYEIRVIPPSEIVSVAGEVIIVLLWLILLLRLRRSVVNVCNISFALHSKGCKSDGLPLVIHYIQHAQLVAFSCK